MADQTFSHFPAIPLPQLQPAPELTVLDPTPCVYLPHHTSRVRAFMAGRLSPEAHQALMDSGFRRSGRVVYQPLCETCRACEAIRVPTVTFTPTKSQRRCRRKNADVSVHVAPPEPTPEKHAIYAKYQTQWHTGQQASAMEAFVSFLYDSPVDTLEFVYRDAAGKLLGIGICDVSSQSLSSVYFYFDPAMARRGLGTFSVLYEIEWARQNHIPYWYGGYYVSGCGAMEYKAAFGPHELLGTDGLWRASK